MRVANVKSKPALVLVLLLAWTVSAPLFAWQNTGSQTSGTQVSAVPASQQSFSSPEEASKALLQAAEPYDVTALLKIFGPQGKDFISSADPVSDKNSAAAFVKKANEKMTIAVNQKNPNRAVLSVGNDQWPLPVPLVKKAGKWYFDTAAGRHEILLRRIGTNELDAIQVCREFVDAQREYASTVHDNSGVNQYAQKIVSAPGKQDGLVWRNADGSPGGPIGEEAAQAIAEGYTRKTAPFHGYYFKVLKGQGPAAPLGRIDYVINGVMIGGFALVAVPADYGVTGLKTFIVSNDGIVYQKDLGPTSLETAKAMELYNPDKTWTPTDDQWPEDAALSASSE